MTYYGEISDLQMDALQEVSNIGLGNAATSLAELLTRKVNITIPKAYFVDFEQLFPLVGGLEELVSCVILSIEGEVPGTVMYIFSEQSTYRLVEMLTGQNSGSVMELDAMGESVVNEVGNILTGSFLNAISTATGLTFRSSVPMFAFDMLGAILADSLLASGHWSGKVLVIDTIFSQEQEQLMGRFFLLPEPGALKRLFEALGLPVV